MYCGNPYSLKSDSDNNDLLNNLSGHLSGIAENWGSGSMSPKQSLVLDGEKRELVKASASAGKKIAVLEAKSAAALKSHSEAERRRRDRINAHLATLRGLLASNEKMDKATLLAQVITELKQLKNTARQASEDLHLPMDTDEIVVEKLENKAEDGSFLLKASLCCDFRPDLLSNMKEAINDLPFQLLKSEISILGGRVKIVFLLTTNCNNRTEELILSSVRAALSKILDKVSASAEFSQQLIYPRKKQRVSHLNSLHHESAHSDILS